MNLVLTHGYFLGEDIKEQKIMRPYPPLGILFISAYLEQEGISNEVFDTTFSSKEDFKSYLLKNNPKYLAIYVNLMTKINVLEIISFVKQKAELSNTRIILGGPDVRYNADNLLNYGADYVIVGEGEVSLLELIKFLDKNEPIKIPNKHNLMEIKGVYYKHPSGEIIKNPDREKIKDLDSLPFPNRNKINLYKYLEVWKKHHGAATVSINTMRGCPYSCKWCSRAVYGKSYRRRSVENVVSEMLHIKKIYNPDSLWFVDDVFTVSHKWMEAFVEEVNARDAKIPYECITRADRLNPEVIKALKESGCFRVWIGAESGSQKIIDKMDRRVKVGVVREMIQLAQKNGIQAGTFIMLGYPDETEKDIEETIKHLKVSNPEHFTITVAYPIKGTELFEEVRNLQTVTPSWFSSTDRDIDFKRTYPRKYYDFAVRRVINEVNFHKKKINNEQFSISAIKLKTKSLLAKTGMQIIRMGITL